MQIFSPTKTRIPLFTSGTSNSKPLHRYPFHGHSLLRFTPLSSSTTASSRSPPIISKEEQGEGEDDDGVVPEIRRPDKDEILESKSVDDDREKYGEEVIKGGERMDGSLNFFAKKISMFEPLDRSLDDGKEKPLDVNLELWLYKAKVLGRKFRFAEADRILRQVKLNKGLPPIISISL